MKQKTSATVFDLAQLTLTKEQQTYLNEKFLYEINHKIWKAICGKNNRHFKKQQIINEDPAELELAARLYIIQLLKQEFNNDFLLLGGLETPMDSKSYKLKI